MAAGRSAALAAREMRDAGEHHVAGGRIAIGRLPPRAGGFVQGMPGWLGHGPQIGGAGAQDNSGLADPELFGCVPGSPACHIPPSESALALRVPACRPAVCHSRPCSRGPADQGQFRGQVPPARRGAARRQHLSQRERGAGPRILAAEGRLQDHRDARREQAPPDRACHRPLHQQFARQPAVAVDAARPEHLQARFDGRADRCLRRPRPARTQGEPGFRLRADQAVDGRAAPPAGHGRQ